MPVFEVLLEKLSGIYACFFAAVVDAHIIRSRSIPFPFRKIACSQSSSLDEKLRAIFEVVLHIPLLQVCCCCQVHFIQCLVSRLSAFACESCEFVALPLVQFNLAKSWSTVKTIVRKYFLSVTGRETDHGLMNLQSPRWVFHCCFNIRDGIVEVSVLPCKYLIRRNACPNADEGANVLFCAPMFGKNIVVCLVTGIVRSKATIFELHDPSAPHTAFLDLYGREIVRRSRRSSRYLPYW